MTNIDIKLTKQQLRALAPLFEVAEEHAAKGHPGVLLAQPFDRPNSDYDACPAQHMRVGFVDQKTADRISNIVAKRKLR